MSKDSAWLQLDVCREFQLGKCARIEDCKFAHPAAHIEAQTGKVMACFDSLKGRCHRVNPACKYFHPPPHLMELLLTKGRNNLALKNSIQVVPQIIPQMMQFGDQASGSAKRSADAFDMQLYPMICKRPAIGNVMPVFPFSTPIVPSERK